MEEMNKGASSCLGGISSASCGVSPPGGDRLYMDVITAGSQYIEPHSCRNGHIHLVPGTYSVP